MTTTDTGFDFALLDMDDLSAPTARLCKVDHCDERAVAEGYCGAHQRYAPKVFAPKPVGSTTERHILAIEAIEVPAVQACDHAEAPQDALFCPMCGAQVRTKAQVIEALSGTLANMLAEHDAEPPEAQDTPQLVSDVQSVVEDIQTVLSPAPRLTHGEMVAGATATAEGCGILVGWVGAGKRTRSELESALETAGLPVGWLPPPKSPHAQAAEVVTRCNARGLVARAHTRGRSGSRRAYKGKWCLAAQGSTGQVGAAWGNVVVTVTLSQYDTLTVEAAPGHESTAEWIKAEFAALVADDVYQAGDVTEWLRGILVGRFRAVRLGGNWYVPHKAARAAEALCNALADGGWGTDWMSPALPVATTDQLKRGLVAGFAREADEVLQSLASQRKTAKDAGKSEIGEAAAESLLGRLKKTAERAIGYSAMLGDEYLRDVRAKVLEAIAVVEPLASDTSARGAAIWDELAR